MYADSSAVNYLWSSLLLKLYGVRSILSTKQITSQTKTKKEYTLSTYLLPRFSLSFILSVDLKSDLKIRLFNRKAVLKVCLSRIMGDIMKISSSNLFENSDAIVLFNW